jgi:hypothetical protein
MLGARNATWAGYLSKAVKPFYASQTSIFNPSDHMDTALTRCYGSLQWPDCTLSTVRDYDYNVALRNRQVTQSIATQMSSQPRLLFLNGWSDSRGTLLCLWNFDRFHLSCLFWKNIFEPTFWKRCQIKKELEFCCFALHSKQVVYLKGC